MSVEGEFGNPRSGKDRKPVSPAPVDCYWFKPIVGGMGLSSVADWGNADFAVTAEWPSLGNTSGEKGRRAKPGFLLCCKPGILALLL